MINSNEIMVQPKKGTKLRDLLKPIFTVHNIDIDKYTINGNDQNNLIQCKSLVDLNGLSENYSGIKLSIKSKDGEESISRNSKLRKKSFQGLKSDSYMNNENNVENDKNNPAIIDKSSNNNNWQNYFGKINTSRDKSNNNKQKRNSCIAVMNDLSQNNQMSTSAPSTNSSTNTSNSITSPGTINLNNTSVHRDSVSSFNGFNFGSVNGGGSMSPCDSRSQNRTSAKNFRKMSQLTNIFVNYGNNNVSRNKEKEIQMEKILDDFLIKLPKLPEELCANYYDPEIFEIEPDWNKFVGDTFSQSLQKNHAKQQMTIWELITTEASHIKTTKVIIDVFLSCLVGLKCHEQTCDQFKDIDITKLFSNIIDVFNCNLKFWQTYLYPVVENLNQTNSKIIDPSRLIDGFFNFKTLFASYEEFILEKANSLENFKKHTEENEFFAKFITWAENNPLVGRLKIADFMMIPVQRLTKYELLLKKIHQFTEDESKREQISFAIDCVNALPNSINIKLKYLAQFNNISESIEKYEGIVGPTDEINEILASYKYLDIKSPLPGCLATATRQLIHQGPLKLKDSPKSFDVHCFLFTDFLLITQLKKTKKYKIIRPPVSTNRIIVRELSQNDKAFVVVALNDYKVPESVCMFISNQSKKWIEFIEIARQKYLDEIERAKKFHSELSMHQNSGLNSEKSSIGINYDGTIDLDNIPNINAKNELNTESLGDNERRDSSTTITLSESENNKEITQNTENNSKVENSNSFKSLKSRHYQQQQNVRFNSRILDRRIQRRNMTDPLSTHSSQINSIIDEKHSVIMNSIIKRNSLNDKSSNKGGGNVSGRKQELATNLCGDSTSTILSTDSGVSENNHISYSDESISKSPSNGITFIENNKSREKQLNSEHIHNDQMTKKSSLKQTNSVLSTTSSNFSTSSHSSQNETPNMSYSSSFNSTSSSSARFPSKSNSLNKKYINENTLNEMENESRISVEDYVNNNNDTNLLSGEDDDYENDEANLIIIPSENSTNNSNVLIDQSDDQVTTFSNVFNESYPTRRLFSTVKIKNNSQRIRNYTVPQDVTNNMNPLSQSTFITDNKDNKTNDLSKEYYDLLHKNNDQKTLDIKNHENNNISSLRSNLNGQVKFQQPNFSLNQHQKSLESQTKVLHKKPLVKIHSTNMTNELIRVNTKELVLKSPNLGLNDPAVANKNAIQQNSLDINQRMTLVKLLHTTMDATEV